MRQWKKPCREDTKMKKLITIGAILAFSAMLARDGNENERSSGASGNSGVNSVGETKIFTLPGGVCMEMVYVAPGSFQMGSENEVDDEKPVHKVTLTNGYWIGKYPVTQAQWNALVSAMDVSFDNGRPEAFFSSNGIGGNLVSGMDTSDFPMENISWKDCTALVDALNKADPEGWRWSLPTEAQWEFAARGGNKSRGYAYSGSNDMDAVGWYYENSGKKKLYDSEWDLDKLEGNQCRPHPVKEKDIGNELGIVGMSGNVWEWCNDWYDEHYYSTSPTEDPQGPASGGSRVLRGGGWISRARNCRSVYRNWFSPDRRGDEYGLRLCCSAGKRESGTGRDAIAPATAPVHSALNDLIAPPPLPSDMRHASSVRRSPPRAASVLRDVLPKNPRQGQVASLTLPGGTKMEMIYVAPGTFTMGSPISEEGRYDSESQHQVTLTKNYWLGKYEVTQAQWESVMGENPSRLKGGNRPVENVSWEDCQRFIRKINSQRHCGARLPTEAEWEFACRAGSTGPYGGNGSLDDMGWYGGNSGSETHPVGQKQANAWGFYDMHGNVYEWCEDWYGDYGSATTDPAGPASGGVRVVRGGCWCSFAQFCRSAYRSRSSPGDRGIRGLRLCCSAEPCE